MKKMMLRVAILGLIFCAPLVYAQDLNWKSAKDQIDHLVSQFESSSLSDKEKIKLMPGTNKLLALIGEIKFSQDEAKERIPYVVKLLNSAIETDFANSMTDTIYFHYKANKKAYQAEMKKLPASESKTLLLDSFKGWEEFESRVDDPAITGKPRPTQLKNTTPKER